MFYSEEEPFFAQRKAEWDEIEEAVIKYKKQFLENPTNEQVIEAKEAAYFLLEKFNPLITKYLILITTGQINWDDKETKLFVMNFVNKDSSKKALKRKKQKSEYRAQIYHNFAFITETYGHLDKKEIRIDLESLILTMAKRYTPMGRNFCSYIYNSYRFEVSRHIKKFLKDPINISYKNIKYEDYINGKNDSYEDNYYEESTGIPSPIWILGECSDAFNDLTPLERNILVKYYLEEWKDKQIAQYFGMHTNAINQKRRAATIKVAKFLNLKASDVKRTRRSGKKTILPIK